MTPAARIVYISALVIGLSVGGFYEFSRDAGRLKFYYSARRLTATVGLADFSHMEYRYADASHARTALLSFASLLEDLQAVSQDKGEQVELADTYTRLALLEDSANDAQASEDFMMKARYWYAVSGGKVSSDAQMKAALNANDKRLEQFGMR
jgi:hypothetical protein